MILHANARWPDVKPCLSVLVPFLGDDPSPLLQALEAEKGDHTNRVEIIILDDGTNDPSLTRKLQDLVDTSHHAICLLSSPNNLGRSKGRNLLAAQARGSNLLFIDADMLPDHPDFLRFWLAHIDTQSPAASFGGFSVIQASSAPEYAVHRSMALRSDCLPASIRSQHPEKHVFTSNLLIRRAVFLKNSFDEDFQGWGWEDVEWAMRVTNAHTITHIDNTATHLGLDTVPALMSKYRQSAANFARIAHLHPEYVARYPSYRIAKILRVLHLATLVRMTAEPVAAASFLPASIRGITLRLYRAALYAKALGT